MNMCSLQKHPLFFVLISKRPKDLDIFFLRLNHFLPSLESNLWCRASHRKSWILNFATAVSLLAELSHFFKTFSPTAKVFLRKNLKRKKEVFQTPRHPSFFWLLSLCGEKTMRERRDSGGRALKQLQMSPLPHIIPFI